MRHAFQILQELGAECDRLGVRAVDVHGQPGAASEFLAKIVAYIEAREAEIDRLSGTTQQICDVPPETSNRATDAVRRT